MAGQGAPTLSDVAKLAGVNRVTASVALNNARANTRISEATRQRVLAAAAQLRYQPNAVARSLRHRRTDILGFYTGDAYSDVAALFPAQIVSGLQKGCRENAKSLLLTASPSARSPEEILGELASGMIDGLLLYTPGSDPLLTTLKTARLPAVVLVDPMPGIPSVSVDDAAGGRWQAQHLAERGHRRIAYHRPAHYQTLASVFRRRAAFLAAAAAYGMTVEEGDLLDYFMGLTHRGQEILGRPAPERPTAVVCWEDHSGIALLGAALRLGLNVPGDLAVVGFDGIGLPYEPLWRLTTIHAPWREVARTAVGVLLDAIAGKEVPAETVLPVELVVGNTT